MAEDFDSLIALLQRTTDQGGYLQPMLDDPDSSAVLGARVTIFARLGATVDHNGAQGTISDASGGQAGTCSLTISRASGATTGTIPAGYPFVDSRGARLHLQADIVVGAQTSKVLPLETDRHTELVNTEDDPGLAVAPDAPTIPGSAGILIAPAGTAGMTSTTFQAIGPCTKISGAAADYLSVHGGERGLPRQQGESDASYRQRIRNIPDAVSPIAVADVVQAAAQMTGLPTFKTLEPFNLGETLALKDLHDLGSFDPAFLDDYDPANPNGLKGGFLDDFDAVPPDVLCDRRMATAYLEIRAQDFLHDTAGAVLYVDDGFLDDPVLGFPDLASGLPPGAIGALLGVVTQVQKYKAAGVNFDLLLRAPDQKTAYGTRTSASFAAVAVLVPTPGTIWAVEEVVASHRLADDSTATPEHYVQYTLEDSSVFTSPITTRRDSERVPLPNPSQRVTQIAAFLRSDGVVTANLYLAALFVEYVL